MRTGLSVFDTGVSQSRGSLHGLANSRDETRQETQDAVSKVRRHISCDPNPGQIMGGLSGRLSAALVTRRIWGKLVLGKFFSKLKRNVLQLFWIAFKFMGTRRKIIGFQYVRKDVSICFRAQATRIPLWHRLRNHLEQLAPARHR